MSLTAMLMSELGFERAKNNSILYNLSKITPYGGTALRDSVRAGVRLIIKLKSMLLELGTSEVWNFVHLVITDGQDSSSKTSVEHLALTFHLIDSAISIRDCSTTYIGIELNPAAAAELSLISTFGGESCNAYLANNVNLNNIFDRISVDIGIVREVGIAGYSYGNQSAILINQRYKPVLQVKRNRFAVLLNLDISGSMAGNRWEALKKSVAMFLDKLEEGDIVSCCVFNDRVQMLHKIKPVNLNGMYIPGPPEPAQNKSGCALC